MKVKTTTMTVNIERAPKEHLNIQGMTALFSPSVSRISGAFRDTCRVIHVTSLVYAVSIGTYRRNITC